MFLTLEQLRGAWFVSDRIGHFPVYNHEKLFIYIPYIPCELQSSPVGQVSKGCVSHRVGLLLRGPVTQHASFVNAPDVPQLIQLPLIDLSLSQKLVKLVELCHIYLSWRPGPFCSHLKGVCLVLNCECLFRGDFPFH